MLVISSVHGYPCGGRDELRGDIGVYGHSSCLHLQGVTPDRCVVVFLSHCNGACQKATKSLVLKKELVKAPMRGEL